MLPQQQPWNQAQTTWAQQLNPLIANQLMQGRQISNVTLLVGNNVIDHKLGRKLQGWMIVDIYGAAQIYRTDGSIMPDKTLTLVSDAVVSVSLWVY